MNQETKFRVISILFRIAGYGAVGLAVYFLVANTAFWIRAESTTGRVVGWERMEGFTISRGLKNLQQNVDPGRAAVVEFETSAGNTVVFASEVGSGLALYKEGEEVVVLYHSDEPENAKIRDFFSLYMGPLMLAVMGGVFGLVGILLQFFYEPTRPRHAPK